MDVRRFFSAGMAVLLLLPVSTPSWFPDPGFSSQEKDGFQATFHPFGAGSSSNSLHAVHPSPTNTLPRDINTIKIQSLDIAGPLEGVVDTAFVFTATVAPTTAAQPITYIWTVTDKAFHTDLENDDGGFQASGWSTSWEWGIPTSGPGSAHSGTRVWATNLGGNAGTNEDSYLTSPVIDLSDFPNQSLLLDWWEWLQPYSWGETYYGELYVRGGTTGWTKVYHGSANSNPSWINQQVDVTQFGGVSDFQFRFHLVGSDYYPGWYVDDIAIRPGIASDPTQDPITHTTGISDTAVFQWRNPGTRIIQVTASNSAGALTDTHAVKILAPMSDVVVAGPAVGMPGVDQTFTAEVSPITSTWPITYIWQVTGNPNLGSATSLITMTQNLKNSVVFNWSDVGTQLITVTATNEVNTVQGVFEITIADPTHIQDSIASNTTWRGSKSPYLVTENILVFEGATLTIEPGVTVWFEDTFGLQVLGTLVARGTSGNPIVFSSPKGQKNKNDWWGIAFEDTARGASFDSEGNYLSGSVLQYVTVEYAGYRKDVFENYYAVSAPSTTLWVDNSTIRHNGSGGLQIGGSGSYVTRNTIWDNAGVGIMIESNTAAANILNNTIEANSGSGISIEREAGDNPITIKNNTIRENTAIINGGGIYAYGAAIFIDSNAISGNEAYAGGGIYASGSIAISGNAIIQNTASAIYEKNGGGGIYARADLSGTITIDNNIIRDNTAIGTGGGVFSSGNNNVSHNFILSNTAKTDLAGGIYSQAVDPNQEHPVVHHNSLQGNSGYALYNDNNFQDFMRLDARYNWWGTDDEQLVKDAIYDFRDEFVKGLVVYVPYLFEPPSLEPSTGALSGRSTGQLDVSYSFAASVFPLAAVTPITYEWQTEGQTPFVNVVDTLYDQTSFSWDTTGTKVITVSASNRQGTTFITHTIDIIPTTDSDDYEADDTCALATPITTTGATQLHNFHLDEDEDWVSFAATADTTYIIEATVPEDSDANVAVEVYDDCSGDPVDEQNNSFSPDISMTFTAPQSDKLYLRLTNTESIAGAKGTGYDLSVRTLSQNPTQGALILVTGKMKEDDPLQANMYNVTDAVYRLFLANGYDSSRIFYVAPDAVRDIDEDGENDVDAVSSRANIEYAITEWARDTLTDDQPLTLYLMDHGGYDVFFLNYTKSETSLNVQTMTPLDLNNWLDQLEATRSGLKVNVIIEACHSGSFINQAPQRISKPGRVVIASTGAYPVAYASATGAVFSDAFVAALGRGMSLRRSFREAERATKHAYPSQTPWLDDNGDGIPNDRDDGRVAAQRGFAYAGSFGSEGIAWPPYIAQATFNQLEGMIEAQIQVQEGKSVSSAEAWIYPPSYQPHPPSEDMVQEDVEKVLLQDLDTDGIFTASYNFFKELGKYRVVIYATDNRALSATPKEASVVGLDFSGLTHRIYLPLVIK